MTYDEYQKYAFMIIQIMKEFELSGEENVRQQDIVEKMVQKIEIETAERQTSIEKSIETSKKVSNVISYLVTKENVLMISQDAMTKGDRYLTLNTNVSMGNMAEMIQGTNEAIY